jgi:hypothetical protein
VLRLVTSQSTDGYRVEDILPNGQEVVAVPHAARGQAFAWPEVNLRRDTSDPTCERCRRDAVEERDRGRSGHDERRTSTEQVPNVGPVDLATSHQSGQFSTETGVR